MKCFLTSSTITKKLVQPFEDLIGKPIGNLKVAFIPDAAYGLGNQKDLSWIEEERQNLIDWYNWDITDFKLKDSTKKDFLKLYNYEVLFVNGGFSGYLAKVMRESGFEELLPDLLEKDIVYVGSSAGSMVMSEIQEASSWYLGEPEPEALEIPGLGYIDFQIYPHVTKENVQNIKKHCNPEYTYYLLPDGSAISIEDEKIKTFGDGIEIVEKALGIDKSDKTY